MLEELRSASEQLRVALDRYLGICSSIQSTCLQEITPRKTLEYAPKVDQEHKLAELYYTTMQQARLAIKITRNHMFSVAPINHLPLEILARIFHMARDAEPCRVDHLALVCSRWRSVAISLPSLWSHIDYHPHISKWFYPELLARAQLHVSRSGGMLLDLHLSALSEIYNNHCYERPIKGFCELIAPRMRSLNLNFEGFYQEDENDNTHDLLSALLSKCVPGVLTKLVIVDPSRFGFISTKADLLSDYTILWVFVKQQHLNNIFSHITVLHLTGLFPLWKSHIYNGLVDLRLRAASTGVSDDNAIPEAQLVAILKASPGLRILHFKLWVTHQTESGVSVPRVHLPELKVLRVQSGYAAPYSRIEAFLRLLEPGGKPLDLSIRRHTSSTDWDSPVPETKAFFQRSNITKLYATGLPQLLDLLPSLPHLQVLALSNPNHLAKSNSPIPADHRSDKQTPWSQLGLCFILDCVLKLDGLLDFARGCKPQNITLYNSQFYRNSSGERVDLDIETVERELLAICSDVDVRVTKTRPSLAAHMELLEDS